MKSGFSMNRQVLCRYASVFCWLSFAVTLVPTLSFNITFSYLEIYDAKRWSKLRADRKESLWSRSLRIPLSCSLSTWQLSKMSFSFNQSHLQRYLIHPIIWLIEQLKISSNQKLQSKADGMKVRIPTVLTRGFLFWTLSASCQGSSQFVVVAAYQTV